MATKEMPIMAQYREMKAKHPDVILLFRVGDFYETFGDDAIIASEILGITLTRRTNGHQSSIELTGFPHHALDTYLPQLVRAGKRVAICEQLENPKLTKNLVRRGMADSGNSPQAKKQTVDFKAIFSLLTIFIEVINKIYIFGEISRKTQEIRALSKQLGISPKKAFEQCNMMYQPSLFD